MKKRLVCLILAVAIALCGLALCGCNKDLLNNVAKNCDSYTIVCAYDEQSHVLSAVQTVDMVNRSENTFSAIKFHLYANAYRQNAANLVVPQQYVAAAYPNGNSWGEITLDCVKLDGTAVAFSVEGEDMDILSVPTGKDWYPNQKAKVEMTYTVQLANIRHRLGWTDNTVNIANFFPIACTVENGAYCCTPYYNVGDPFVSDVANFDVTLKVAEQFVVACSGNLDEATSAEGFVSYKYGAKAVRDFAMVVSDKFKVASTTIDGVAINYYYFADDNWENSLATAAGAYRYYNKNVGTYPYKQISVCETEFCYGGMEYPGLVMVTSGSKSYREAIAHEMAHQWFYGVVGNNQIKDAWMDEGLAEFLTALYLDDCGEINLSQSTLAKLRTYTTYTDVLSTYYGSVDTSFRALPEYRNDNEYVVITYVKGCLLFNTLYETMGKTKFFKALAHYYTEAAFTVAGASQLASCFAKVGGNEIATILTQFVEGKEILGKVTD